MTTGEKSSRATAVVQGKDFTLLLDNGSHDANYINGRVAEELGCLRFKENLRVRLADGNFESLADFVYIEVLIKFKNSIIFQKKLKFYIFPTLAYHLVIGRGDLVKYKMYGIMEMLDRAAMGISDGREGEEEDTIGVHAVVEERKSGEAELAEMESDLDEAAPNMTDWSRGVSYENKEFENWVTSMRKEMVAMVESEYSDIFAIAPPSKPADVWEQKLELIGEPIDTPEGLRKVPGALKGMGRRIPLRYVAEADKQIQEMLAQGVIELSTSAISVPINLTPKPNSSELRFCLDCRQVNTLIRRENFPMAGISEFTAWMEFVQPEFFVKLDLKAMYFQLPLEKRSRLLTAFNFNHQKFQFTRVVMGTANAVGHAQNVMVNQVLAGLVMTVCFVYLDDVIIPGNRTNPNFDLFKNTRAVLQRFRERSLYLNEKKCEFFVTETLFLGHMVSRRGLEMSPKKKIEFATVPRPVSVTNLRSFLALANFFRRFLPTFAERSRELYKLTGGAKTRRISWTEETTSAFEDIKKMVDDSVVLRWLTPGGEISIFCDASKFGFGGGIFQDQGETYEGHRVLTPIAFWGRAFSDYQVKWHTSDREMFAICFGITTHHHLLAGRAFTVYTDHAALVSIRESASEKINRMKEKLAGYDMTMRDIEGSKNVVGDGMSRIFIDEENYTPPESQEDIEEVISAYSNQTLMSLHEDTLSYLPWLRYYHGERGHWPLEKTMEIIRKEGNEWPQCENMMKEYIEGCSACTVNAPRRQFFHGGQYSISSDGPGQSISVDLKEVGEGYDGHKYILVIIDNFSRRATLYPLRGKSKEEATYMLWHHIMDSGRPECVRYDPGREFNNEILKEIIEFLGAQAITTAAGDHNSNGIVERFIGELDGQLRRYFQSRPRRTATDWIWFLPAIAKNHNEMPHGTTGVAPNEFHGEKFWRLTEEERGTLIAFAKENISKKKPIKKDRRNGDEVIPGTQVYISVEKKEKRNLDATNWEGPFRVSDRSGDIVEVDERRGYKYHIARLKLA